VIAVEEGDAGVAARIGGANRVIGRLAETASDGVGGGCGDPCRLAGEERRPAHPVVAGSSGEPPPAPGSREAREMAPAIGRCIDELEGAAGWRSSLAPRCRLLAGLSCEVPVVGRELRRLVGRGADGSET
jgi:hypothetical protein